MSWDVSWWVLLKLSPQAWFPEYQLRIFGPQQEETRRRLRCETQQQLKAKQQKLEMLKTIINDTDADSVTSQGSSAVATPVARPRSRTVTSRYLAATNNNNSMLPARSEPDLSSIGSSSSGATGYRPPTSVHLRARTVAPFSQPVNKAVPRTSRKSPPPIKPVRNTPQFEPFPFIFHSFSLCHCPFRNLSWIHATSTADPSLPMMFGLTTNLQPLWRLVRKPVWSLLLFLNMSQCIYLLSSQALSCSPISSASDPSTVWQRKTPKVPPSTFSLTRKWIRTTIWPPN